MAIGINVLRLYMYVYMYIWYRIYLYKICTCISLVPYLYKISDGHKRGGGALTAQSVIQVVCARM